MFLLMRYSDQMANQKAVSRKRKTTRLSQFGCVSGLLFEHGGSAEVVLDGLELQRIIEAWAEHEAGKKKQDERIISALRLLAPKAFKSDMRLVAEVPIAQKRAKITPVF